MKGWPINKPYQKLQAGWLNVALQRQETLQSFCAKPGSAASNPYSAAI